jgi:hypothetical protein
MVVQQNVGLDLLSSAAVRDVCLCSRVYRLTLSFWRDRPVAIGDYKQVGHKEHLGLKNGKIASA